MNKCELDQRVAGAREVIQPAVQNNRFLGIIPGTGWKDGLTGLFKPDKEVQYADLHVPGAESSVEGHSKSMQIGTIERRPVMVLGRVHPNESTDPDIVLGMRVVIESVRDNLDGLIITNGVGTLHGPVNRHLGRTRSAIHTWLLTASAEMHTGRKSDHIGIGKVAVVDSFDTTTVGRDTPLLAGEFVDLYHDGYHNADNRFFGLGEGAVSMAAKYAPLARFAYMHGPQFEGSGEKIAARARGCDVIGMSGLEGFVATKEGIPFSHLVLTTNGAFDPHSHDGNLEVGRSCQDTTRWILSVLAHNWPRKEI